MRKRHELDHMDYDARKRVFGDSDQVRLKSA